MGLGGVLKVLRDGRRLTCEACGQEFGCGALSPGGCWCAKVETTEETRAELKRRYRDCLCPSCLERASAQNPLD